MAGRWLPALLLGLAAAANADDGAHFDVLEFEIVGNSVLPVEAVERAVLPYLGEGRSLADVEAARGALEKVYQAAGYLTVLVDVPEQRIVDGVVQLKVVEGRVESARVTGARYFDQGVIRERVAQLAPGSVPDFNAMQKELGSLSREERQIQPLLRPGLAPGTVEAELKVADRLPMSANVEINDRHAAGTSRLRAQATLRYDNLFQREHSLAITLITAPLAVTQSRVLSFGYTAPLTAEWGLAASLVLSDSTVEPLGATTVVGRGTTWGLRLTRSFADAAGVHTLSAGIDAKNLRERVVADASELSTPVRYAPVVFGYSGTWFGERRTTSLSSTLTAGLRGIWARSIDCPGNIGPVDQFACKREGADGAFSTWRNDLRQTWGPWSLRIAGQLATQPLLSSEQFAIGGADTVRGYHEAEASGDLTLLGSAEWRSANVADWFAGGDARLSNVQALAFVDAGGVRTLQPAAGQAPTVLLSGAGVGLRVRAGGHSVNAEFDVARPFKATPATPDGSARLHVRIAAQF